MKALSTLIVICAWLVCFALSHSMNVVFSQDIYANVQTVVMFLKTLPIVMAMVATAWWYLVLKNK